MDLIQIGNEEKYLYKKKRPHLKHFSMPKERKFYLVKDKNVLPRFYGKKYILTNLKPGNFTTGTAIMSILYNIHIIITIIFKT